MRKYINTIMQARLVRTVDTCLTTGDLDYPGTAIEVRDNEGEELFHVVVDSTGERQVLFFPVGASYRLPLDVLERVLSSAKEKVRHE